MGPSREPQAGRNPATSSVQGLVTAPGRTSTRRWAVPLLALVAVLASVGTTLAEPQSIAVPAYFYPSWPDATWERMGDAAPVVSFAVMNPASGPGIVPDSNYVAQVDALRAAGVKVLGYVTSSYAARDAAAVREEIDRYYAWYPVDGIFVDEADNHCDTAAYYAGLDGWVKSKGGLGLTVINPGTVTPECFAASADILLNFEGSHADYLAWAPLGWEASYPASRFWHLVYATNEADVPSTVLLSQERGAGYVYVTPDALIPNPWDTLPDGSYWSTELAYVQPGNQACAAAVARPKLQAKGFLTAEADDSLRFSGNFALAGDAGVDPVADGLRVTVADTAGTQVDVTLPAGAYAGSPGSGWLGQAGKWAWHDDRPTPVGGIARASLKASYDGSSTTVGFKVTGKRGTYPLRAGRLPLVGTVMLSPSLPGERCATASFPGSGGPTCTSPTSAASIACK